MKLARTISLLIAAAMPLVAAGAEIYPSQTQPATASAPAFPPLIQAIQDAPDPSSAVGAYAKALSGGADQVTAEKVYLIRMTEFGLPEMADAQAQDLLLKDPDNGLAWAVAAHMSARRGNMAAALGQIETATNRAPDNLFVLRTAGGVFAWYDSRGAGQDIPDVIKAPIPEIKKRLQAQQTFATAYDNALTDYQNNSPQNAQAQAMSNTTTASAPPATQPTTQAPPPEVYVSPPVYYPATEYVYDSPTYYYPAYAPSYGYCAPYWYPGYSSWCGPWFGFGASFVFVSNNGNDCNWNGNNRHGNGHWNGNWNGNKNGNWNGHGNWDGNGNWNGSGRGGFAQGGTVRAQSARPAQDGFVGPVRPQADPPADGSNRQVRSRDGGGRSGADADGRTSIRSRGNDSSGAIAARSSGGNAGSNATVRSGSNASVRSGGGSVRSGGGAPSPPVAIRSAPAPRSGGQSMGPARPPSSGGGGAVRSSGSGGGGRSSGGGGGGSRGGGGGGRR